MIEAQCCCGTLVAELPGPTGLVVACHCVECRRRTGAPYNVGAFYPCDRVRMIGDAKEYQRPASSGASVRAYFCPNCGTTVHRRADRLPAFVGLAVGATADPQFPHSSQIGLETDQTSLGADRRGLRAFPDEQPLDGGALGVDAMRSPSTADVHAKEVRIMGRAQFCMEMARLERFERRNPRRPTETTTASH
jgi:hypothetical protein